MSSRLNYWLRRTREAGPRAFIAKVNQRLRPYLFYPLYCKGSLPSTGESERASLLTFGALCRSAFSHALESDPTRRARVNARRTQALSGKVTVLGYGTVRQPAGEGWHADPLHGYSWPRKFFPNVDFLASDIPADVKIPWEMSRLQHLVWLAEASVAFPEEAVQLRAAALTVIVDWFDSNPPGFGVNWTCGMEVAIRGVNMAMVAAVFAEDLDQTTQDQLCAILRAHLLFLARFPEVSDVPGNHYLCDLMGEVVLHAVIDGLSDASTADALDRFADAAELQFEPDGCHLERATIYHRLALDIVALPYALALKTGDVSRIKLAKIMHRASDFMGQISNDAGQLPVFGDQDSGFVLWFGDAAQIVDRRLCAAPEAPLSDMYGFLSVLAATERFFPETSREDGVRSGFGTLSGRGFRVTMKTGPIGLNGRAAHDHDDSLAVAISCGAHPLVVDHGCHSYTLDSAIRFESIVSSRHNAPAPAKRERHAPMMGSINATVRGAPTAILTTHGANLMSGNLERTSSSKMALTRTVKLQGAGIECTDDWRFDTPEGARMFWLFHPDWIVDKIPESVVPPEGLTLTFTREGIYITALLMAPSGTRLAIETDRYSPDYGAWAACPALYITTPEAYEGRASLRLEAS